MTIPQRCGLQIIKKTPKYILSSLSTENDFMIRTNIARNPSTPITILKELVNDRSVDVKFAIIQNPSTPLILIKNFTNDSNITIRVPAKKRLKIMLLM